MKLGAKYLPTTLLFTMFLIIGCRKDSGKVPEYKKRLQQSTEAEVAKSTVDQTKSPLKDLPGSQSSTQQKDRIEIEENNPPKKQEKVEENPLFEDKHPERKTPPEKDPPIPKNWTVIKLPPRTRTNLDGETIVESNEPLLYLEILPNKKRRLHMIAEVCLRQGSLEEFLCKSNTKEHESILRTPISAEMLHAQLIVIGAKPGSPATFYNPKTDMPEYHPANGTPIQITLTYYKDQKLCVEPAQSWVKNSHTNKALDIDWVFAGSRFVTPPADPDAKGPEKPFYCAESGDVISIANFPDSMLDLPIESSKVDSDRGYTAFTERIPSLGTKVIVTLETKDEDKKPAKKQ